MQPIRFAMSAGLLWLLLGTSAPAAEPDKAGLAKKAQEVLRANCYRCHGREGSNEGGFSYALDRQRLVSSNKVVPGQPDKSRLLKRVKSGDMPPEDEKPRPSDGDVALLTQWIQAGAPDFNPPVAQRRTIFASDVMDLIRADLNTLNERDRRFARYFTLVHLFNAGCAEDELDSYRMALSKLVNSLSWGRQIIKPTPIDPSKTVLRIDLRDYKWSDKSWELILSAYPYGVRHVTVSAKYCYGATDCRLPYIRADWFIATASRPPLYHEILLIPATDRELERMLQVDVEQNIQQERIVRAGFNGSGVSRSNRLIERHESPHGAYWKSYDFAGSSGRQNLFEYPLGPTGTRAFQHDGGEIIFSLPNGLQGYMLSDGKGNRIDKGPTAVVSDPKQADRAVVNGISCMSCHAHGMIEKGDQIRDSVLKNPKAFDKEEKEKILSLYKLKKDLDKVLQEDADRFAKAVAATGGRVDRTGKTIGSDPVVNVASIFERDLDLVQTAAEAGVKVEVLVKAIDKSPRLGRALGSLKVEGGTVQREQFIVIFRDLVEGLEVGVFIAPTSYARVAGPAPAPAGVGGKAALGKFHPLVVKALEDLKSDDKGKVHDACRRLTNMAPTEGQAEVARAIEPLLESADGGDRTIAADALAVWGDKNSVTLLLKRMTDDHLSARGHAILALGKLKDERAIKDVAFQMTQTFHLRAACDALRDFGPAAEREVQKYIRHKDNGIAENACKVLKDIGTSASEPALMLASRGTNKGVAREAQEALKGIKARQQIK